MSDAIDATSSGDAVKILRNELDEPRYIKEIRSFAGTDIHGVYTGTYVCSQRQIA